ncbi:hypothetical protein GQ600_16748 [Phytophthora cactorum]|nr:hypothetical protein GQ600_16748 [Phytophthora cactorum]
MEPRRRAFTASSRSLSLSRLSTSRIPATAALGLCGRSRQPAKPSAPDAAQPRARQSTPCRSTATAARPSRRATTARTRIHSAGAAHDRRSQPPHHLATQRELGELTLETPVEELARVRPGHHLTDAAHGLHTARRVVEVTELRSHLHVDRQERLLAGLDLSRDLGALGLLLLGRQLSQTSGELLELVVQTVHGLQELLLAVLDLNQTGRLQHTTTALRVGVHLHDALVDGRVHHGPGATTQLSERRDVHEHRLLIVDETVHNGSTELEHLVEHVALATGESAPVSQDEQRQVLALEVLDGRSRLVRRVREPHLTSLLHQVLLRRRARRVSRDDLLGRTHLRDDHTARDSTETAASNDHALGPAVKRLAERVLVHETGDPLARRLVDLTSKQCTRVVLRALVLGAEVHRTLDLVHAREVADRKWPATNRRHEAEPLKDRVDAREVVLRRQVRHTVRVHDFHTTKLVVRRVHVLAHELVQRLTDQVGTDADTAAAGIRQREHVLVGTRRLAGDGSTSTQTFHTDIDLATHDVVQHVALLARAGDQQLSVNGALSRRNLVVLRRQIQVFEALDGVGLVLPADLVQSLDGLGHTDASTSVGREEETRNTLGASQLRRQVEQRVLAGTEGSGLESDVVGDDNDLTSVRELRRVQRQQPRHHADVVLATRTRRLRQRLARRVQDQLTRLHQQVRDGNLRAATARPLLHVLAPLTQQVVLNELQEVVHVHRVGHDLGHLTLLVEREHHRVRRRDGHTVQFAVRLVTDRGEDGLIVASSLDVRLHAHHVASGVLSHEAHRDRGGLAIEARDDLELHRGHSKLLQTLGVTVRENADHTLQVLRVHNGLRQDVEVHVVVLGRQRRLLYQRVGQVDFQSVQSINKRALGARVGVVLRTGAAAVVVELAHHSTHEDALEAVGHDVRVRLLHLGQIQVNVLILRRQRCDAVVLQTTQLQLVGERGLHVAQDLVLAVFQATGERVDVRVQRHVRVVHRDVLDVLRTHREGHTTNVVPTQIHVHRLEVRLSLFQELRLLRMLVHQDDVKNVHKRVLTHRQRLLGQREQRHDIRERFLERLEVRKANDGSVTLEAGRDLLVALNGLGQRLLNQLLFLAALLRVVLTRSSELAELLRRRRLARSSRGDTHSQCIDNRRLELERLGKDVVKAHGLHRLDEVRAVHTQRVQLQSQLTDLLVLVVEQRNEQVEERLGLVQQVRAGFSKARGRTVGEVVLEDLLHLAETVAVRRHLVVNQKLTRLQSHQRVLLLLERREFLEERHKRSRLHRRARSHSSATSHLSQELQQQLVLRLQSRVRASDREDLVQIRRVLLT